MRIGVFAAVAALVFAEARGDQAVDPAAFGFDPSASAAVNAAALQKALDGGGRTVKVAKAGEYQMDRTVFVDDDTELEFAPGTVLVKTAKYPNVIVNRGAYTGVRNRNITVRHLGIRVNGCEAMPPEDSPAKFLRGQLAFCRMDNAKVYDFTCTDIGNHQYCVQFVDFDGVLVDGFDVRGEKDGFHFNYGRNFTVRNGVLSTGDDGLAINAGDWPDCAPMIGTLENGLAENIRCLYRRRFDWKKNGSLGICIAAAWPDWHEGIRLHRNDMVRHGKNVYAISPMPFVTNEYVSVTAPTHTNGVWKSPEGISFLWVRGDGETRADVKNMVFRNIDLWYENCLGIGWETGYAWSRAVHPEIRPEDYPVIDVRMERVRSHLPGAPLIRRGAPSNIVLDDCSSGGTLVWAGAPHKSGGGIYPGVKRTIEVRNCDFSGSPKVDFRFHADTDNELNLHDNRGDRAVFIERIEPARVMVKGDTPRFVVDNAKDRAVYEPCVDAWTQLPFASVPTADPPKGFGVPVFKGKVPAKEVRVRDGIGRTLAKLRAGEKVRIAYFGGSITQQDGWRCQTTDWLKKEYPKAQVVEYAASIGGTGSELGAYRLAFDVLRHEPDLVFVEFATNDGGRMPEQIWKSMEGIVRQTWKTLPETDIVFVYTITSSMLGDYGQGLTTEPASAMEQLADHYGIPSITFGPRVVDELKAGRLVMKLGEVETLNPDGVQSGFKDRLFAKDGVHPTDYGHSFYLKSVQAGFAAMASLPPADHAAKLVTPFMPGNLENAKFVDIDETMLEGEDWNEQDEWNGEHDALLWFVGRMGRVWKSQTAGDRLKFRFRGDSCAILELVGLEVGAVEVTVDGVKRPGPVIRTDGYGSYFRMSALPVYDGEYGEHEVEVAVSAENADAAKAKYFAKQIKENPRRFAGNWFYPIKVLVNGEIIER